MLLLQVSLPNLEGAEQRLWLECSKITDECPGYDIGIDEIRGTSELQSAGFERTTWKEHVSEPLQNIPDPLVATIMFHHKKRKHFYWMTSEELESSLQKQYRHTLVL